MFIQTEETPNPQVLKFLPDCAIAGKGKTHEILSPDEAGFSPLAERLFATKGVQAVFLGADFVSVTKKPDVEWEHIKPSLLVAMGEHLMAGAAIVLEGEVPLPEKDESEGEGDETVSKICEIIETRVRPAVAQDGGDIVFKGFEGGVVFLEMRGACSGCPSSTMTLKNGVENLLRHYIPEVKEVRTI